METMLGERALIAWMRSQRPARRRYQKSMRREREKLQNLQGPAKDGTQTSRERFSIVLGACNPLILSLCVSHASCFLSLLCPTCIEYFSTQLAACSPPEHISQHTEHALWALGSA